MKKLMLILILMLAIIIIALVNKCKKELFLILFFCLIPGIVFGAEVTLNWKPNAEHDLKEYRLYKTFAPGEYIYGEDSENYITTITAGVEAVTIFVEDEDVDFLYWVITAVNNYDLESGPSNEVCIEEPEPPSGGSSCFILTISKIRRLK